MSELVIQIIMLIGLFSLMILSIYLSKQKNKNKIHKVFSIISVMLQIYILSMFAQLTLADKINVQPIYFEYITGCVAEYIPVVFLIAALLFFNENVNIKKLWWLFIIPSLSLLSLWTNDLYHLFYKVYSIEFSETVYGPMFIVHSIYAYATIFVATIIFIFTSMKKSGFFSKQTALIVFGCLIPIFANILATFKIVSLSVYITPVLFGITAICFTLAIKYKALNITPVAFKTVINTMSDAYVVISDDGTIADMNKTFEKKFSEAFNISKEDNLFEIIENMKTISLKKLKENILNTRKTGKIVTDEYHFVTDGFDRYFEVDIHPISASSNTKEYIGTLLLLKDITQHKEDIKQIEEKQDIIVKQGQLVSIGELAGGVAHDINTPISAIKTGIVMLNQMDKDRSDDEKEILQRMDNCATKIINIVNSMRNQIRNLGGDTNVKFKISEVVNDVKIITYHEVAKNNSEVIVNINDDLEINGDPTKLGQVLTNLVVNAAQAYGEDKGGKVEVTVEKAPKKKAIIKVTDYAGGLDPSITPYIFKNILTTKGTFGTGLGLYLAYSVIKGNFNGDITFETEQGEGTTFYITIPIS